MAIKWCAALMLEVLGLREKSPLHHRLGVEDVVEYGTWSDR